MVHCSKSEDDSLPTLDRLPDPPSHKTGWPWTEQSDPLPKTQADGAPWPKISIVTPSYNYGQFIEKTIRSVLLQRYPNLEYIVVDGGSTDQTAEILEKYDPWIDHWVSEPDDGQSDAINKGFDMSTGTYGGWINSDDWLCKDALRKHARRIGFDDGKIYAGTCLIYKNGSISRKHNTSLETLDQLVNVRTFWQAEGETQIVQPETLFPMRYFEKVDGLNVRNHYSMDFELWGDMLCAGASVEKTGIEYGVLRSHENQKIADARKVTQSLLNAALRITKKNNNWNEKKKKNIIRKIKDEINVLKERRLFGIKIPKNIVEVARKTKKCFKNI